MQLYEVNFEEKTTKFFEKDNTFYLDPRPFLDTKSYLRDIENMLSRKKFLKFHLNHAPTEDYEGVKYISTEFFSFMKHNLINKISKDSFDKSTVNLDNQFRLWKQAVRIASNPFLAALSAYGYSADQLVALDAVVQGGNSQNSASAASVTSTPSVSSAAPVPTNSAARKDKLRMQDLPAKYTQILGSSALEEELQQGGDGSSFRKEWLTLEKEVFENKIDIEKYFKFQIDHKNITAIPRRHTKMEFQTMGADYGKPLALNALLGICNIFFAMKKVNHDFLIFRILIFI